MRYNKLLLRVGGPQPPRRWRTWPNAMANSFLLQVSSWKTVRKPRCQVCVSLFDDLPGPGDAAAAAAAMHEAPLGKRERCSTDLSKGGVHTPPVDLLTRDLITGIALAQRCAA